MRLTEVEIVRESVKKVVGILSNRNIPVTQVGGKAFVEYNPKTHEPIRVNLPYLPDNATPELLTSIQGFLDHEVGHLLFSTQASLAKSMKLGLGGVYGVLEDTFVERKMRQAFKGSQANLGKTIKLIQEKLIKPRLNEAIESGSADRIQSELLVSALRAYAGEQESQEFMKPYWDYMKPFEKMVGQDVLDKIKTISSSEDALKIAVSIQNRIEAYREKLEKEKKEKEEKEKSKSSGDGKGQKQQQKQENTGDDETESDPSEDGEKEGESSGDKDDEDSGSGSSDDKDEEDSETEEEKSGSSGGKNDKSKSDGKKDDSKSTSKSEEGADSDDPKSEGDSEDDGAPEGDADDSDGDSGESDTKEGMETEFVNPEFIQAALSEMKDMDKTLSDVISTEVRRSIAKNEYVPLTTDNDVIEPYCPAPHPDDDAMLGMMEDRCSQMTGILQKRFERTLAARSAARLVPGFKSGRIHAASLFRAKLGDERVFRKKIVSTTKDVAVTLLIDLSGSMSGRKVDLALTSGLAMSLPLDRMGIKHEVLGFTTSGSFPKIPARVLMEHWKEFHTVNGRWASRLEPIYMPVFKSFDQRLTADRKRSLAVAGRRIPLMNNTDGESVLYAAKRLQARKESRKVMIVLSDGCPCQGAGSMEESSQHLIDTVKKLSASGIEMFGIGIMSEYVADYYPNYVVINDISDLPVTVMNTMESMLLGAGKK